MSESYRSPISLPAADEDYVSKRWWTDDGAEVKLGKAWLVSRLHKLLQQHRLHLPQSSESDALARELLDYAIRVDENADDRHGAFRTGVHDDIVTAIRLAPQEEMSGSIFAW